MRTLSILCFAAVFGAASAAGAEEETKVHTPDGQNYTVRSDEAGTTVSKDGKTQGPTGVTPMEAQHQQRVKDLLNKGGVITEQKNMDR